MALNQLKIILLIIEFSNEEGNKNQFSSSPEKIENYVGFWMFSHLAWIKRKEHSRFLFAIRLLGCFYTDFSIK
jgi:hypothetical protein